MATLHKPFLTMANYSFLIFIRPYRKVSFIGRIRICHSRQPYERVFVAKNKQKKQSSRSTRDFSTRQCYSPRQLSDQELISSDGRVCHYLVFASVGSTAHMLPTTHTFESRRSTGGMTLSWCPKFWDKRRCWPYRRLIHKGFKSLRVFAGWNLAVLYSKEGMLYEALEAFYWTL